MRARLLTVAAVLALAAPGRAADPEINISYELRIVTIPADAGNACGARVPAKEGEVAFLTDAQFRGLMDTLQGQNRINVMSAPKITAEDGKEAVVQIVDRQTFVTGLDATLVKGQPVLVPKNVSVETGETITVTGKASADRTAVATTVKFTSTRVPNVPLLPVTTMVTPVFEGGNQGKPVPVTQYLQVPNIDTLVIEKQDLTIPSGGHAVVAGPTQDREVRTEVGPPVLSKIPYLNRLYKNVGVGRESVRTFLVVTPRVLDVPAAPQP